MRITLNRDAIKAQIRQAMLSKLNEREGEIKHTNTDGLYSPARWWYDRYNTSLGGYLLSTSGNFEAKESGDKIKLVVTLTYGKMPR